MKKRISFFVRKIIIVSLFLLPNLAYANLMITPTRVELGDRNKVQEVRLINTSNEITTYRISFQHLRMLANGTYEEIENKNVSINTEEKEKFVDDLIRYSPKRITLKPRETQTIRLMFRKTKDFKEGEYRSHLLLREEPPVNFGNNIEKAERNDGKISVVLKPLFGISIPVIVKSGLITGKVEIESLAIVKNKDNDNKKSIAIKLNRTGNSSLYGDIKVFFTSNESGKKVAIGEINGIAVFYPYKFRQVLVELALPKATNLSNGKIDVEYSTKGDDGTKSTLLAKKSLEIN